MDSHRYYRVYASSIIEIPSLIEKARADHDSCKARIDAIELEMLASVSLNCHPGHMEELEAFIDANSSLLTQKRALQTALQGHATKVSLLEAVINNPAYAVHMQEAQEGKSLEDLVFQEKKAAEDKWAEVKNTAILNLQEKGLETNSRLEYYRFTTIDPQSIVEGIWVTHNYHQIITRQYTVTIYSPAYILTQSKINFPRDKTGRYFYIWTNCPGFMMSEKGTILRISEHDLRDHQAFGRIAPVACSASH